MDSGDRPDPTAPRARVLAFTLVALLLNELVCNIGLLEGYVSALLQGANLGAFINGLTVLIVLRELVLAKIKSASVRSYGRLGWL